MLLTVAALLMSKFFAFPFQRPLEHCIDLWSTLHLTSTDILQIVRLALANRGVGLLPFNLAGISIVLVLMHVRTPDSVAVSLTILAFWSMLITFTAVALAGMGKLVGIEDRKGTEYLLSDEMIDVGVQVGLYAVFWIIEASRLVKRLLTSHEASRGAARLPEQPHADGLATSQSAEDKPAAMA